VSVALSKGVDSSKVFVTSRTRLEQRWDPNYYRCMSVFRARVINCPHPIRRLRPSLEMVQYGISELATEEPIGVPMLRMINLQSDTWDLSDLKYIAMSEKQRKPYLLRSGDILFNRTNSKELVGKCCVFNLSGEYVFASYLIRVQLKQDSLLPDYVAAFLASPLGRIQIDAVSRQIAGMTNINAEEIRDLFLPVPSRAAQEQVAGVWRDAIRRRDQTLESGRKVLASIDDVLLDQLGIERDQEPPNTIENRMFRSSFRQVTGERWDPIFHHGDIFHFVRGTKCDLPKLGDLVVHFITGFAAGRADQSSEEGGIIQIRPTNLSEDRELIFRRNIYIAPSELKNRPLDVLHRHEVLFNNTNSQELVGKTTYFDLPGDYFCSNHITRIATNSGQLDEQFLTYVLNLYQRQKVFFKLCTNWNNQSGVGTDVLETIPIPLPDLIRQKQIVSSLERVRIKVQALWQKAASELDDAKKSIEAIILGQEGIA
jgi:type I restriction enzyme S subunit